MSVDFNAAVFFGVVLPDDWEKRVTKRLGRPLGDNEEPGEVLGKMLPDGVGWSTWGEDGALVCVGERYAGIGTGDPPVKDVSESILPVGITQAQITQIVNTLALFGIRGKKAQPKWQMIWSAT